MATDAVHNRPGRRTVIWEPLAGEVVETDLPPTLVPHDPATRGRALRGAADRFERELFNAAEQAWSAYGPGGADWRPVPGQERARAILDEARDQRRDDTREVERENRDWIDDRSIEDIDPPDRPSAAPNYSLADGLRPFIEGRTSKQQLTLLAIYWRQATIREASQALGSDVAGTKSGSAQSNRDQAIRMLRRDLLAAYAPDDDLNEPPTHACILGRKSAPPEPDPLTAWIDGRHHAEHAPVRIRYQAPQPDFQRPEPAEFEWRKSASREDLYAVENWKARGFVSGPPDERRTRVDAPAAQGRESEEFWTNFTDYWLNPDPPAKNPRPWRTPYARKTPIEQAVVDSREWSADRDAIADVLRREPNETDRGGGLHGVPRAFRKVWDGLVRSGDSNSPGRIAR